MREKEINVTVREEPVRTDHRSDIKREAEDLAKALNAMNGYDPTGLAEMTGEALPDEYDDTEYIVEFLNAWVLEVEYTARTSSMFGEWEPKETRVVIGLGGPTVYFTYDHVYDTAELFHSWGAVDGTDRNTWPLPVPVVREFVETWFPHPAEET